MSSVCSFELERAEYYSGETIEGTVQLITIRDKKCRDIFIEFEGVASVRWNEGTTEYADQETYAQTKVKVYTAATLAANMYTFPFSITIPNDCPPSCDEQYGSIKYIISLVINRPLRFDNIFGKEVTILKRLDLNKYPELRSPLSDESTKSFGCLCCVTGSITSTLTLPCGGYVPGEEIKCKLDIDNQTKKFDLRRIHFKFIKHLEFRVRTVQKTHTKKRMVEDQFEETRKDVICLRLSKISIEGLLTVPPVPPTCAEGILKVLYQVIVCIKMAESNMDCDISIPVVIGTVPFKQNETSNASAQQENAPIAPNIIEALRRALPKSVPEVRQITDLDNPTINKAAAPDPTINKASAPDPDSLPQTTVPDQAATPVDTGKSSHLTWKKESDSSTSINSMPEDRQITDLDNPTINKAAAPDPTINKASAPDPDSLPQTTVPDQAATPVDTGKSSHLTWKKESDSSTSINSSDD